jgi:hypothetical protein
MSSPIFWLALAGGVFAGAWQAHSLARSARGGSGHLGAVGRLLLVAVVLVLAARAHQLAIAVTGWVVGLVANGVAAYRRLG